MRRSKRGVLPVSGKLLERDIVKAIRDLLRVGRIWNYKSEPLPIRSQEGISDLIGIRTVKVSDLVRDGVEEVGVFLAIEVKRPGGKVSPAQTRFIENVRENKGIAFVAYSASDVVKGLGLGPWINAEEW